MTLGDAAFCCRALLVVVTRFRVLSAVVSRCRTFVAVALCCCSLSLVAVRCSSLLFVIVRYPVACLLAWRLRSSWHCAFLSSSGEITSFPIPSASCILRASASALPPLLQHVPALAGPGLTRARLPTRRRPIHTSPFTCYSLPHPAPPRARYLLPVTRYCPSSTSGVDLSLPERPEAERPNVGRYTTRSIHLHFPPTQRTEHDYAVTPGGHSIRVAAM